MTYESKRSPVPDLPKWEVYERIRSGSKSLCLCWSKKDAALIAAALNAYQKKVKP